MRTSFCSITVLLITLLTRTNLYAMDQDNTLEEIDASWEMIIFEVNNEGPFCPLNSPAIQDSRQKSKSTFRRQTTGLNQPTIKLPTQDELLQLFIEYELQELLTDNHLIDDLAEQTATMYDVYTHVCAKNWNYFQEDEDSYTYEQNTALRKRFHTMLVKLFLQASNNLDYQIPNTDD